MPAQMCARDPLAVTVTVITVWPLAVSCVTSGPSEWVGGTDHEVVRTAPEIVVGGLRWGPAASGQ